MFGTSCKEALLRHEGANLDEVRDLAAAGTRYLASDTTGVVCPVVPQRPAYHALAPARVRQPGRGGPFRLPPVPALPALETL